MLKRLYEEIEDNPFTSYRTDSLVEEVSESIDADVEESDIDYALNRLDDEYLVDYSPALNSRGHIILTPRGADELQREHGGTFLEENDRYRILAALEELEKENPGAYFDGGDFRDGLEIDNDIVDLNIWYMIKKGWVEATMVAGSPPYTTLQIDSLGRQQLERFKNQSQRESTAQDSGTERGMAIGEGQDIEALVDQEEDVTLEFKETFLYDVYRDQPNTDLKEEAAQEICAFANTEGGNLIIGVEDGTGEIKGLERDLSLMQGGKDEFERQVNQEISNRIGSPFASLFIRLQFVEIGEKEVCLVSVGRAPEPVYCGETFYVRNGSSSIPLDTPDAINYINENWS